MNTRYVLAVLLLCLHSNALVQASEKAYTVIEGKGIESVGFLRGSIRKVQKVWGKADRVFKDDHWPGLPLYVIHEYHERGVSFLTTPPGKIIDITLYCRTDDGGLPPPRSPNVSPPSAYQPFRGITTSGLVFGDLLTSDDVYRVYGKPEATVALGQHPGEYRKGGTHFVSKMEDKKLVVEYPAVGLSCTMYEDQVESCTILNLKEMSP